MNLSTERKNHINSVLDEKTVGCLLPILETGQSTCKAFMDVSEDFFKCIEYLNNVPGTLLTYSINRELANQSKLPLFPFKINNEIINKRNKYCIPILNKDNITISVLRSSTQREIIDNCEKTYLKKKCIKNNELDDQISFLDLDNCENDKFHGVLLYGAERGWEGIKFADIIFFDDKLRHIYHSVNLLEKLRIYESTMSDSDKEKSLLNAQNIIKEAKIQLEV